MFPFFPKCSQNFSVCMEPVAYVGGTLGFAPLAKYAIAWSSAPDPAGKRIELPRFRSSDLGIELRKRNRDEVPWYLAQGRILDHFNQSTI